jgi:hypothetical protein
VSLEAATRIASAHDLGEVRLLGKGHDHEVWLAQGQAIRIALDAGAGVALARERMLLSVVGPSLSIPTPSMDRGGLDPEPYVIYPLIPGEPQPNVPLERAADLGHDLGAFLGELHRTSFGLAVHAGARESSYGLPQAWENAQDHLGGLECSSEIASALSCEPGPHDGPLRLVHGDLVREHVLVEGGRITGVIDWSNACLSDPAGDFTGIRRWLGAAGLDAALAVYPMFYEDSFPDRVRTWALCEAVADRELDVALGLAREILASR